MLNGQEQTQEEYDAVIAKATAEHKNLCVRATDGSDGKDKSKWATNGLRWTVEDALKAMEWGSGLFGRWMACKGWFVDISPDDRPTQS